MTSRHKGNLTEQRLDMALDDLVERRPARGGGSDDDGGGRRGRDRGPYSRSAGKGKNFRRIPPEDKALLHTHCFFNTDGDFVVRLYDTEVFMMKQKPGAADSDGKPAVESTPGIALVLTSGKFRTVETRYILNEAMHTLDLRVMETDGSWKLSGSSVEQQTFEDGMEVQLKDTLVRASAIKQHLESKIHEAKMREAGRSDHHMRGHGPSPGGHGQPPAPPVHVYPHHPPPGWPHPPPPGWSQPPRPPHGWPLPPGWGPPASPGWPPWGADRPRPPGHAGPPGLRAGVPMPRPGEPLPDDLFQ